MTKFVKTKDVMISAKLMQLRKQSGLKLREVSSQSGIDQGLISKYEKGKRNVPDAHLSLLAEVYGEELSVLRKMWLAEKVTELLRYEEEPQEVWSLAEERIEYLKSQPTSALPPLDDEMLAQLDRIDRLRGIWLKKRPAPGIVRDKMLEYVHTEYTYESNRIEGNTLTLAETHLGVEQVERMLFRDPPEAKDGKIAVPAAPGVGVELDRDARRDTLIKA